MNEKKLSEYHAGRRNLIFATVISIPGPLLLAISLTDGSSATGIADLIRRSCEFLTIFLAWMVYEFTAGRVSASDTRKARLEAFVKYFTGLSMCLSGAVMIYVAVANFGGEKGKGMKKINEGYCAELFEVEGGKLLKLYKQGWSEAQVRQEYECTKAVCALGVPSPKVYDFAEQEGRFGFVMDKLPGETMLQIIQKTPFQAIALAKQMAKLQYDMHCLVPGEAAIPPQKEIYAKTIKECAGLTDGEKNRLCQRLEKQSTGEQRICHGDFHAMNIMLRENGVGIIDWAFTTLGDPSADVAGSYMITKILAAASGGHNAFERFLFNLFTPIFAEIYLKEYLKLSGKSRGEILRWIPIRAATYVDLGLPEKANQKLYAIAKKR